MKSALFQPITQSSVSEAITEQIETLILDGILRDGAKLPSERDLSERFNVSRPKVREALKVLEQNDLIIVRHGEGTFVAPLRGAAMLPALIALYGRRTSAFLDYLEYRREQEGFAARLAAERATDTDREILGIIMGQLEQAHQDGDAEASGVADIQFHSAIVDASHNSLLVHTMASIYELSRQNLFYNRALLNSIDGTGEMLLQQHRDIYDAIIAADTDAAEAAAIAHVDFVEKSYITEQNRMRREKNLGREVVVDGHPARV